MCLAPNVSNFWALFSNLGDILRDWSGFWPLFSNLGDILRDRDRVALASGDGTSDGRDGRGLPLLRFSASEGTPPEKKEKAITDVDVDVDVDDAL